MGENLVPRSQRRARTRSAGPSHSGVDRGKVRVLARVQMPVTAFLTRIRFTEQNVVEAVQLNEKRVILEVSGLGGTGASFHSVCRKLDDPTHSRQRGIGPELSVSPRTPNALAKRIIQVHDAPLPQRGRDSPAPRV